MRLDRTSRRVLGSLLEKRFSTPEQYPLTLNAVVLACNQKSNRDPEMQLEEFLVEGCLRQLRLDGWITVVERDFGRAVRYAERVCDQLGLSVKEGAILAELMLRGPQTEQELHRRCERMVRIDSADEALALLDAMASRGLVQHLPRETGQRIARWRHLLTPPEEDAGTAPPSSAVVTAPSSPATTPSTAAPAPDAPPAAAIASPAPAAPAAWATPHASPQPTTPLAAEVAALRREVDSLRAEVATLREEMDAYRGMRASESVETPRRPGSPYV